MWAMIGPDLQAGVGGFGDTIRDAMRDLAGRFEAHCYKLDENRVMVEAAGKIVTAEGQTPGDAIRKLAWIVSERGYTEHDFPELDWDRIAREPPLD
jgi:hypothetical protein